MPPVSFRRSVIALLSALIGVLPWTGALSPQGMSLVPVAHGAPTDARSVKRPTGSNKKKPKNKDKDNAPPPAEVEASPPLVPAGVAPTAVPAASPAEAVAEPAAPASASPPPARPIATAPTSAAAKPAGPDLERLRREHSALRDALFRSRARRDTLESALLSTQIILALKWDAGRRYVLKHAELRLDGVRIWDAGSAGLGDQPLTLAPRSLPPGAHVLGVRVQLAGREDPKRGYTSDQTFSISLPEGKKTTVEITIDEDGDAPSYEPDITLEIDD